MARHTRAIEVMDFCSRSPVTRILCFGVICSLHMFTKIILSDLILAWGYLFMILYRSYLVISLGISEAQKERWRKTTLFPACSHTRVRHAVLWSKEEETG